MIPKEITQDSDTGENIASFNYYDGIAYANEQRLRQTTNFSDVFSGTHFIVCCGDVMVKVLPEDYSEIERRII